MSGRLLTILALSVAVPAIAQTPVPPVTHEPAKPPKPKLICKTYAETGSLIARSRVCKTAMQWRQESEDIQNMNSNRICNGSASCSGGTG